MPLTLTAVLGLIQGLGPIVSNVINLAHGVRDSLGEHDQAKLDAALATLRDQNDATFLRVDQKLDAAKRT